MTKTNTKLCHDLLNIIDKQEEMIKKQKDVITELVNENMEKENMVNVLMTEFEGE